MAGITERNQQKNELANAGFTLRYIDEWQPKTTLYRHKPSYNIEGEITEDVGTTVRGVPGSPDYVLRKAKIGLFPWPPSESCTCRWCSEGNQVDAVADSISDEAATHPAATAQGIGTRRMGPHFRVES
jgi:hypothetical protein